MSTVVKTFDAFARRYDSWFRGKQGGVIFPAEVEALRILLRRLRPPFLEVGVGTGAFAEALGVTVGVLPATRGSGVTCSFAPPPPEEPLVKISTASTTPPTTTTGTPIIQPETRIPPTRCNRPPLRLAFLRPVLEYATSWRVALRSGRGGGAARSGPLPT